MVVKKGETITFTFAPSGGYGVYKVTMNGADQVFSGISFTFKANSDVTSDKINLKVEFAAAPTLTVNKTEFKDNLNFGEKTNFSWKAEGEITSITLNG